MSPRLPTGKPLVVLIVEDRAVDEALLHELLDHAGADARELLRVRSLADAVATLFERDADIVLLNLQLSGSDSLETFMRLQALAPGIPIVPHNGLTRMRLEERFARPRAHDEAQWPGLRHGPDIARCLQRAVRRRAMEQSLLHLATHDPLTGAANRLLLEDRLRQAVARSGRAGLPGALLFLDLDDFKRINDIHGHESGDRVLVTLAGRLNRCLRSTGTVARYGGDEFVVLVEALAGRAALRVMVDEITRLLVQPIRLDDGFALEVSASVGVSLFPDHGRDMATLIRHADTAMYHAKRAGHGLFRFAAPELLAAGAA